LLNKIIRFSIKQKFVIGLFTIALVIWGIWSANRLPVDAVPNITNNQVQVITVVPTLAAQETEQLVTYPIEQSMTNIPGLVELRSISRFGLSVITAVFKDDMDIYFARQLINERLKEAEEAIPKGIGKPALAPVSTGLGEIYQYMLHAKKGAEDKYSPMDLRVMQDWIVARQLYGIQGVAEVNSFGGSLKQYEVAVNPLRLKSMNVTISDIFNALHNNNENTGGAYIDKKPNAYFIRGIGMVSSLEDIRNTVVKTQSGIPVLIKDVADVGFGTAVRYGAMSYNGDREVVGGIVMMLKGANSAAVATAVKEKMISIQQSLPPDVEIEAFLDRTDLVGRAISTVKRNLIEGALIVIFVLVIFLGNFRAGLIVASAIPLSLLFALGMMNLFGVSANLMSLGAIDFGLIVDGAVIIVEATMHHLQKLKGPGFQVNGKNQLVLTKQQMDAEVYDSASKIRNSAAFGEIIILIVYIPIFTLTGIEGKMFKPMAQTVSFAILGALILSVTYIPMISALFLSKKISTKTTFSDRMMAWLESIYLPLLKGAIKVKFIVISVALALMIISITIFSRMGGEFIPQLQEGDLAFHCILPQGTSLSQSIETSMQASRILKSFPEVKMVVAKTGSAEVPTDPMPPEASDLVVVLKPKEDWPVKKSYTELGEDMMEQLEIIPGVFFEVSQPIQMRFNELMTGVRQDVAVKIFGSNIDTLAALAPAVSKIIQTVNGATDPQVEQTTGLPQIAITYDRTRLASYGMNITDINHNVSTAFAGEVAGVVYEDEKKFDLVVRLDSASRGSIEDVKNLFVPTPNGIPLPLAQLAKVSFVEGPAQISREDGKRRIVVGFNVRDRDVASVVQEIQQKLSAAKLLPTGYFYTYGGTFQNLQDASARLLIAVPVALVLILVLLYFTFGSIKDSLLIYTAIPMSAIGGVFALLIRDMPFSISAGVGFIALFGVAVLNGIVLISTFKTLQKEGIQDVLKRVITGTIMRLRPVLMTASVASLGFLPMAISSGAGAEVQRPLATVVIGGLITATVLTLFVLPLLYIIFNANMNWKKLFKPTKSAALLVFLFLSLGPLEAQERITADEAVQMALRNNLRYQINKEELNKAGWDVKAAMALPKTGLFVENEDLHSGDRNGVLKIGVSQTIEWPGIYKARRHLFEEQLNYYRLNGNLLNAMIKKEVNLAYLELWYLQDMGQLYQRLDTLFTSLYQAADLRVKTGDAAGLDRIAAAVRMKELRAILLQNNQSIKQQQQQLSVLLNTDTSYLPSNKPLEKLVVKLSIQDSTHPALILQHQNIGIAQANVSVQQNSNKPEFSGRFFSQHLYGIKDPFSGFSVSVGIPLFGQRSYQSKVKSALADVKLKEEEFEYQVQQFSVQKSNALLDIQKANEMLLFYEQTGLKQSEEIIKAATLGYQAGELSFAEMSQFFTQAIDIRKNYLAAIREFNLAVITYHYFVNQ